MMKYIRVANSVTNLEWFFSKMFAFQKKKKGISYRDFPKNKIEVGNTVKVN